jgi:hypothetical protein
VETTNSLELRPGSEWPLERQRVALEAVPQDLARAMVAHGVVTWADVAAIREEQWLVYPGLGTRDIVWLRVEMARRRAAQWSETGPRLPIYAKLPRPSKAPDIRGVYFIRLGVLVKIGLASSVRGRFQDIQTGIPFRLDLLGVVPVPEKDSLLHAEREFHDRFREYRQVYEWFRLEGALEEFCRCLASV